MCAQVGVGMWHQNLWTDLVRTLEILNIEIQLWTSNSNHVSVRLTQIGEGVRKKYFFDRTWNHSEDFVLTSAKNCRFLNYSDIWCSLKFINYAQLLEMRRGCCHTLCWGKEKKALKNLRGRLGEGLAYQPAEHGKLWADLDLEQAPFIWSWTINNALDKF